MTTADEPRFTITHDWITSAGLRALTTRVPLEDPDSGYFCGYVGIRSDHVLHGKIWSRLAHLDVHGGVTHASNDHPIHSSTIWWIGFDCCHGGDFGKDFRPLRTQDFVNAECEKLATQLNFIARNGYPFDMPG